MCIITTIISYNTRGGKRVLPLSYLQLSVQASSWLKQRSILLNGTYMKVVYTKWRAYVA